MQEQRIHPRDNQIEAHAALTQGLTSHDRVQAHMCCGSGKTFTQAFLARELIDDSTAESPVVVCFVPNRDLIHQNAANFHKVFGDSVDYLGVCSPQESRAPAGAIDPDIKPLPLTTDQKSIQNHLDKTKKPTIIFSTYQSAKTTQKGLQDSDDIQTPVLLGLFDEAHRTAGDKDPDSLFAFALFEENMEIENRAFFTATPRIVESRKKAEQSTALSMADTTLYGPKVYDYPFSQGIEDGNVVDYDLWTPVITPGELKRIGSERGIDDERGLNELMAELAISKVMEETGQARFLTYHRLIADSKAFSRRLEKSYGPKGFTIGHIDGNTDSDERKRLLNSMKSGSSIVSNCKAFVEGVDAPGLQGIAFIDKKSSVVEIVQAIGRTTRSDPQDLNKRASIIVPMVIDPEDKRTPAEQAKDQGYGTLIQVIQALGASDNKMADTIRESSRAAGENGGAMPDQAKAHNLRVLALGEGLSPEDLSEIGKTVSLVSLTATRDDFAERVGRLQAHLKTHGQMPTSKDDAPLNRWVQSTRLKHRDRKLDDKHAAMLDDIDGWSWLGPREKSVNVAAHMSAYFDRKGRPGLRADNSAERELAFSLRRAENHALGNRYDLIRQYGVKTTNRARDLSEALDGTGLLFLGNEVPAAAVSGRISKNHKADKGDPEYFFIPSTSGTPVFRTGLRTASRAIGLQLSQEDRERINALDGPHSISVSIERAGRDKRPFMDGKITAWHAGSVDRGEKPGSTQSVPFFINRLKDRKLAARPVYTLKNMAEGVISKEESATCLSKSLGTVTVDHMLRLSQGVRRSAAQGRISEKYLHQLDEAPGFSWVDPGRPAGLLAPAVEGLVGRHGIDILTDRRARRGDSGLANSLRAIDQVVEQRQNSPRLEADMAALRKAGTLRHITTFNAARKKEASAMVKSANIEDKTTAASQDVR